MTHPHNNAYLYDADDRICAEHTVGTGNITGYLHDASGNRVAKGTISTLSCNIFTNGFQQTEAYIVGPSGEQLTEVDGSNNWKHTNVYAGGKLIATYDSAGLHFHFDDPLGTRRAQANSSGVLEDEYQSLPFGDGFSQSGSANDPTENHFTGKERDTESGLDYFGARYYASSMGRFMSPDWAPGISPIPYADISDPQTLNLYSYVRNNPLSRRDADGHHQECAPDTSSTGADGSVTVTAGACHEVPDPPPPTMLQNIGNWFSRTGASLAAVVSRSLGSFGGPRAGKPMTPRGKQQVVQRNAEANGGKNVCENCGQPTVPAQQSQAGVSRPGNENAVDHIYPMSKGGDGDPQSNGQLLCSTCNGIKSDSLPTTGEPIVPVEPIVPIEPIFIDPIIIP